VPVAYFTSNPPKTHTIPLGLRPPELILGKKIDNTLDIWAFGCLVFEFIANRPLYFIDTFCSISKGEETDDHLLMFRDTLGPLPDSLYSLWTRSSKYYTPERVQFNSLTYKDPEETDLLVNKMKPLEEEFDEDKPDDLSDEEGKMAKALIRRALQYDTAKRPTPSQLLQDPFFTS
jgi:serine/threonine protein kinase